MTPLKQTIGISARTILGTGDLRFIQALTNKGLSKPLFSVERELYIDLDTLELVWGSLACREIER